MFSRDKRQLKFQISRRQTKPVSHVTVIHRLAADCPTSWRMMSMMYFTSKQVSTSNYWLVASTCVCRPISDARLGRWKVDSVSQPFSNSRTGGWYVGSIRIHVTSDHRLLIIDDCGGITLARARACVCVCVRRPPSTKGFKKWQCAGT